MAAAAQHLEIQRLEQQSRRGVARLPMMNLGFTRLTQQRHAATLATPAGVMQRLAPRLQPLRGLQKTHLWNSITSGWWEIVERSGTSVATGPDRRPELGFLTPTKIEANKKDKRDRELYRDGLEAMVRLPGSDGRNGLVLGATVEHGKEAPGSRLSCGGGTKGVSPRGSARYPEAPTSRRRPVLTAVVRAPAC